MKALTFYYKGKNYKGLSMTDIYLNNSTDKGKNSESL